MAVSQHSSGGHLLPPSSPPQGVTSVFITLIKHTSQRGAAGRTWRGQNSRARRRRVSHSPSESCSAFKSTCPCGLVGPNNVTKSDYAGMVLPTIALRSGTLPGHWACHLGVRYHYQSYYSDNHPVKLGQLPIFREKARLSFCSWSPVFVI